MPDQAKDKDSGRPPPVIVPPTPTSSHTHTHTFILLHGLGNNGSKFGTEFLNTAISSKGKRLRDEFPGAKFIFPTAKWRRSSAFSRTKLTQWFDVYQLGDPSKSQHISLEGFAESAAYLRSLIREEMEFVPAERIVLGGISQGCAMSLLVLLSLDFAVGAYVGMCGWLPLSSEIRDVLDSAEDQERVDDGISFGDDDEDEAALEPSVQVLHHVRGVLDLNDNASQRTTERTCLATPIFLGHGARDEKVSFRLGEDAASTLSSLGMDVTWKCYPGLGHWYEIPGEIDDILAFLDEKL